MKDLKIKHHVLQEIMDIADSHEGEKLKKHPKLTLAKAKDEKPEETESEPEMDQKSASEDEDGEVTHEQLQQLLEQLQDLK